MQHNKYIKIAVNIIFYAVAIVLICIFVPKIIVFFGPFVVGWIISMIANPLVRFLEKKLKIVRKHSSVIIIVAVIGLIITGGYFAVSKIIKESVGFMHGLPLMYQSLVKDMTEVGHNLEGIASKLSPELTKTITTLFDNLQSYANDAIGSIGLPTISAAGNMAKNIPTILVYIIFTILSSYFFIADRNKIVAMIKKVLPQTIQKQIKMLADTFSKAIGGYFKAQFKIMGIIAAILFVGFLILGVNYAILWAILIAFLDFLPFFGTGTALVPWALVKLLSGDYGYAIGLVVIYLISQLVRQLIQPKIVGDSMGVSPLATLIFMFIGYQLKGVMGMILAVPIGIIVINLYEAGTFDGLKNSIKILIEDFNAFRKV